MRTTSWVMVTCRFVVSSIGLGQPRINTSLTIKNIQPEDDVGYSLEVSNGDYRQSRDMYLAFGKFLTKL